ncbi:MAG TPA: hypothetical protein VFF73_27090 [Planctomycetota bacterium]|nr:hypothetical protein [Planctomycetota bacterium]
MHPRRTSKLERKTRRQGDLRKKRTSMAEEETTLEKESMAKPAVTAGEPAEEKAKRHGASRPRNSKRGRASWPRPQQGHPSRRPR